MRLHQLAGARIASAPGAERRRLADLLHRGNPACRVEHFSGNQLTPEQRIQIRLEMQREGRCRAGAEQRTEGITATAGDLCDLHDVL